MPQNLILGGLRILYSDPNCFMKRKFMLNLVFKQSKWRENVDIIG